MTTFPAPKSYEEHLDYLYQIVRLKLFFLWHWVRSHQDEPFRTALENRVDIFRKTDINTGGLNPVTPQFDDPAWVALAEGLESTYNRSTDPARFEQEAFSICRPTITARSRRDYECRPYVLDYRCGSLTFQPPQSAAAPDRVIYHIANACAPRSIFDDPKHLALCLKQLMDMSEAELGATALGTDTWLHSHRTFLKYFPREYQANMSVPSPDVKWHYGFWGQFITARGTFNETLGRTMRATKTFPYATRGTWCTFAVLRKHLENNFNIR